MTDRQQRPGFTLLELVLAASITAVIFAALLQALLLITRMQSAGRDQIVLAQIGRNLMRQMEWDLSHLVLIPIAETASEDEVALDDLGLEQTTINDMATGSETEVEGEMLLSPSEMIGSFDRLEMRIDAELTEAQWKQSLFSLESQDPTDVLSMDRRRRQVIWNPLSTSSGSTNFRDLPAEEQVFRQELFVDTTEAVMGDARLTLVPEVSGVSFLYFDGLEWYEDWDSTVMLAYPKCIQMTLTLEIPDPDVTVQSANKTLVLTRIFAIETSRFVESSAETTVSELEAG